MRPTTSKKALWYVAVGVGLAMSLTAWRADSQRVFADQLSAAIPATTSLVTHVLEREGRATRVIVLDPLKQAMGVYDIGENGEIQLKSVRKLSADLQMMEFNSGEPSPVEIQKRLEQR